MLKRNNSFFETVKKSKKTSQLTHAQSCDDLNSRSLSPNEVKILLCYNIT